MVTFNGLAALAVPSTTDPEQVTSAIDSITVARGTAIGAAILVAIDAIADSTPTSHRRTSTWVTPPSPATTTARPPVRPRRTSYRPDIIVVLTDGSNSRGVEPTVAAAEAAARGLRVYAIGFGTSDPAGSSCTSAQLGSGVFEGGGPVGGEGGGGPRGGNFLTIDEGTLAAATDSTGGEYFRAADADALDEVFAELRSRVELQTEEREITIWFARPPCSPSPRWVCGLRWNRVS